MLKENEKYTLVCEEMNNFGNGVCRIDGMIVFVSGAVIGDTVEAEIKKVNTGFALAEVTKIITPSSKRTEPVCPHFNACGGCSFCHTDIDTENEVKGDYVRGALKRLGIEAQVDNTVCPVADEYRNKVILFYNNGAFGYMARATNTVVAHSSCPLNERIFDEIANFTLKELDCTHLRALYMRKGQITNQIMVCPIFKKPTDIEGYARRLRNEYSDVVSVLCGVAKGKELILEKCELKRILGDGYIEDYMCGLKFRISAKSFYQINHACASALYEKVISLADVNKNDVVADLFCGTGTIGAVLAKRTGAKVYGVEIEPEAVRDARNNALVNGISNIEFFEGDAKSFDKAVDVCIIDPPRKGCSPLMLETLLRLKPRKIVYVSCNPDTLARDLKELTREYNISSPVTPFNMFPRTSHVETIVCLRKQ